MGPRCCFYRRCRRTGLPVQRGASTSRLHPAQQRGAPPSSRASSAPRPPIGTCDRVCCRPPGLTARARTGIRLARADRTGRGLGVDQHQPLPAALVPGRRRRLALLSYQHTGGPARVRLQLRCAMPPSPAPLRPPAPRRSALASSKRPEPRGCPPCVGRAVALTLSLSLTWITFRLLRRRGRPVHD